MGVEHGVGDLRLWFCGLAGCMFDDPRVRSYCVVTVRYVR